MTEYSNNINKLNIRRQKLKKRIEAMIVFTIYLCGITALSYAAQYLYEVFK